MNPADFKVRMFVLMYGDHEPLHRRLLESLDAALFRSGEIRLTIWANTVGESSLWLLGNYVRDNPLVTLIRSNENVPKYKVMRQLYAEAYTEPWTLWMDDDSYITRPDWFSRVREYLLSKSIENVCYVGQKWYVNHLRGQWEFIQASPWFKGVPARVLKDKTVVDFHTGGYVWLRTDVLRQLDWPDLRLNHNGGDTLLGEAIRQQGLPLHNFDYGVKVNDAKRRGLSERPAGSEVNTRR